MENTEQLSHPASVWSHQMGEEINILFSSFAQLIVKLSGLILLKYIP